MAIKVLFTKRRQPDAKGIELENSILHLYIICILYVNGMYIICLIYINGIYNLNISRNVSDPLDMSLELRKGDENLEDISIKYWK